MAGTIEYVIDRRDCLVSVNESWVEFARENTAPELATDVIGIEIWQFISNATVRQLYRHLLAAVRAGSTFRIPFRCDAPGLRREMVLDMHPETDGAVAFRSELVSEVPQSAAFPRPPKDGLVVVCGWCARVHVDAEWLSTERAIDRLGLFQESYSPPMTHGICGECHTSVFAQLSR